MSKQTDSIISLGEHAALAIERAHSAFQQAKITGAYSHALLMNYAELKGICGRFEGLVSGIAGEAGYQFSIPDRVTPTVVELFPEHESPFHEQAAFICKAARDLEYIDGLPLDKAARLNKALSELYILSNELDSARVAGGAE